jgi:hypothetical protein
MVLESNRLFQDRLATDVEVGVGVFHVDRDLEDPAHANRLVSSLFIAPVSQFWSEGGTFLAPPSYGQLEFSAASLRRDFRKFSPPAQN